MYYIFALAFSLVLLQDVAGSQCQCTCTNAFQNRRSDTVAEFQRSGGGGGMGTLGACKDELVNKIGDKAYESVYNYAKPLMGEPLAKVLAESARVAARAVAESKLNSKDIAEAIADSMENLHPTEEQTLRKIVFAVIEPIVKLICQSGCCDIV